MTWQIDHELQKDVHDTKAAVVDFVKENKELLCDIGSHVFWKAGLDMEKYIQMLS